MPTGVLAAATKYTEGREGFWCGTPLGVAIVGGEVVGAGETSQTKQNREGRLDFSIEGCQHIYLYC